MGQRAHFFNVTHDMLDFFLQAVAQSVVLNLG